MISAFGVDHEVSKAMSPNKLRGLKRIAEQPEAALLSPERWRQNYASTTLSAHRIGRDAANWMSPKRSARSGTQFYRKQGERIADNGKRLRQIRDKWDLDLQRETFATRAKRRRVPFGESPYDVVGKAFFKPKPTGKVVRLRPLSRRDKLRTKLASARVKYDQWSHPEAYPELYVKADGTPLIPPPPPPDNVIPLRPRNINKALKPAHVEALSRVLESRAPRIGARQQRQFAQARLDNESLQWGAHRAFQSAQGTTGKNRPSADWRVATRYKRIANSREMKLATKTPYKAGGHNFDARTRVLP